LESIWPVPDPVAFSFGRFEVRWYGIIIAIALVIGIFISYLIARYRNKRAEEIINFAPFAVIFGVIGARLLHVLVNWSYYSRNLSYIFAFRRGGLAIQGVILGGVLALLVFCKIKKLDFWLWADIISPALVIGQAIGRWGNYFNQEAFGMPTSPPWGLYIDPAYRPFAYSNSAYFMPTFFYESIANFVLFGLLLWLHRLYRHKPDRFPYGLIFSTYLGVYAVYRSIIEYFRLDSSLLFGIEGIKVVYVLDIITIIAVLIIVNYLVKRFRLKKSKEKIKESEK